MFATLYFLATAVSEPLVAQHGNPITMITNQFGVDLPFLLAQMINFGIVAFVLYQFAFKPVLVTLDQRQKKIADGLEYAEEMKKRLADAQKRYEEIIKDASMKAQEMIEAARQSARIVYEKQTKEAAERAEHMIKRAEEAIVLEHTKMLAELKNEVADLVVKISMRVMGQNLTDQQRNDFASNATKELISK
jgi:F-type H+-transporting ATPase subunit b